MKRFSVRGLLVAALAFLPFLRLQAALTSSNLPLIYITTDKSINADAKVAGTMRVIWNGDGVRNNATDTLYNYDGPIGIKWRGNSSLSNDQKKYTLETWNAAGEDSLVSLLGLPEESDWVLLAPYNDISLVRDVFAFDMWTQMGHWAPRTRMCEVTVNDEYMGVYALCERIKRDKNRVDVAKLKDDDLEGRDLTGGYIVRVDAYDSSDATFQSKVDGLQPSGSSGWGWGGGSSTGTVTWTIYYPKKADLKPQQTAYIQTFVDNMEQSFQQSNFADTIEGYAKWIDVPSFVDYFIHTELSLNADGFKRSSYFFKDKDHKDSTLSRMEAGPVWDYNLAYGNCNFCNANNVEAWVYEGCSTNPTPAFWTRLTRDPHFMEAVRTRYAELRATLISQTTIDNFFDTYAALLDEAKERHYAKYSNLFSSGNSGGWGWWGGGGGGNTNPTSWYAGYQVASYAEEITTIKAWFAKRLAFLDKQWSYDATSVGEPITTYDGHFRVTARCHGGTLAVAANTNLQCIDVFTTGGTRILRYMPADAFTTLTLPLSLQTGTNVLVVCYAANGGYLTRTVAVQP